jgi:hypothetical protein
MIAPSQLAAACRRASLLVDRAPGLAPLPQVSSPKAYANPLSRGPMEGADVE